METVKRIAKIKNLIDNGIQVYDENEGYQCLKDRLEQYLIVFKPNGYCIGLTSRKGDSLNATKPFYYKNGKVRYL